LRRLLVFGALVMVGIVVAACGGNANKDDYTRKNTELLDTLPLFPGAELFRRQDLPYADSEMGPITGYGTSVQYHVGADVSDDDVVKFYEAQLGADWTHCEYEIHYQAAENPGATPSAPGSITSAVFYRGDGASLGVLTDGLAPVTRSNSYELDVDYHNAKRSACATVSSS